MYYNNIQELHEIINEILISVDVEEESEELFDISLIYSYDALKSYADSTGIDIEYVDTDSEDFKDFTSELTFPVYDGIIIVARSQKYASFAKAIQKLVDQ